MVLQCVYANANGAICLCSIEYVKKKVFRQCGCFKSIPMCDWCDVGRNSTELYTHLKLNFSCRFCEYLYCI